MTALPRAEPEAGRVTAGPEVLAWLAGTADSLGAVAAVVLLLSADEEAIQPVWSVGYDEDNLTPWRRIDLSLRTPLTDAARDNAIVTVETAADLMRHYPEVAVTAIPGHVALAAVPIPGPRAGSPPLGVLGLSFADAARLLAAGDRLGDIADRLSTRLLRPGRGFSGVVSTTAADLPSTGEPADLARLAAVLLAARTPEEVLDLVMNHGRPLLGADMINIMLLEPSRRSLRLVASRNIPDAMVRTYASLPVDAPLPTRDALRSGGVYLRDREERDREYPTLASAAERAPAIAVLPLPIRDGAGNLNTLGVIGFGWPHAQPFDEDQTRLITEVTELCAVALERSDWSARQQTARLTAERTADRLGLLQTLIRELSQAATAHEVAAVIASAARTSLGAQAATLSAYDGKHPARHLAWTDLPPMPDGVDAHFGELMIVRELVLTRQPVLVTSTADRDARYPDMAGNGVPHQAWANLPLIVANRFVGTAAFGWLAARDFADDEVEFMSSLAAHAAIALDRAVLLEGTTATAETLQRALLPRISASLEGWDVATRYIPAVEGTKVGGDWYDVFTLPGGRIGLVLGDVAGKGVPAAAIMGAVRGAVRAYAMTTDSPAELLRELDLYTATFVADQMVTLCYAVLDPTTGVLRWANAGHPPPLLVTRKGTDWLTQATSAPLGLLRDITRIESECMVAAPGDQAALVLYSDGLIERRGESIWSGLGALAEAARDLWSAPDLQAAVDLVVKQVEHANRTVDDLAILAVRRR